MGRAKARLPRSKATYSAKKRHKNAQLPKAKENKSSSERSYKKLPGFDAFNVQTMFKRPLSLLDILILFRVKLW
jgi:hypothetical protein